MSFAIIGFGNIGHALAKAFARKGIEVSVATTRDPASFAADAAAIGHKILPKTLAEAVKADIIFLAVRFDTHPDGRRAVSNAEIAWLTADWARRRRRAAPVKLVSSHTAMKVRS
jgi:8-hydroxy-5-deazaflavin:NADPH oxidoreductase